MKTKQLFKKPNVTTILKTMLLAIFISFTTGCENENIVDNNYADSEYLELNKYKFEKLKKEDIDKIVEGFKRLEKTKIDGVYVIEENSPTQLNMSKKLLFFLVKGQDYTNNNLEPQSKLSKITRLKSDNYEFWDDDQQPEDPYCFSYSIAALGTYSFESAKNHSDNQYGSGNGVPLDSAEDFFKEFYPNGQVLSLDDFSSTNRDMSGTIVILKNYSNGKAHAVNGALYFGEFDTVWYRDSQSNTQDSADTYYVVKIFKP